MKHLNRLVLVGLLLTVVTQVKAQAGTESSMILPYPQIAESQSYTYAVEEDGTARVWLRSDNVAMPKEGGEYQLTLPENQDGEVWAWYRDSGCMIYQDEICMQTVPYVWEEAVVNLVGKELTVTVPERRADVRDEYVGISIGISFQQVGVTEKSWWGREVELTTAAPKEFVSYLGVGVNLPDGVYGRDKQQGPQGWNAGLTELVASDNQSSEMGQVAEGKMAALTMLEVAGGGQIYRQRQNLMPGEDYTMSFLTSTTRWTLYYQEILGMLAWIALIALVLSLLLYLIIGKKPWWWYALVMVLLMTLFALLGGLWLSYSMGIGGGRDYPMTIMSRDVKAPEPMMDELRFDEQMMLEDTEVVE